VSRGAGIVIVTKAWQDMMAHGLTDEALPACQAGYSRLVTRAPGTGQQRWLGDVHLSTTLLNWAHLYQRFRRNVPDELYRAGAAVERIEAAPDGATLHLARGGSLDFDLVVCADGYRSLGRGLVDPGAAPAYRGMVLWRGLLPERDVRAGALDGCDLLRPVYQGGHGVVYYVPGPGPGTGRGSRPSTPSCPAATRAAGCAWSATPARCSRRSRGAACCGR
jgi:2-polyprenyl-6-methoxyphenol hydroxylase-like FAD-dependent oxidoreductase